MQRINDEKSAPLPLARWIDHTKLMFAADEDEQTSIERLCREAKSAGFYAVCVQPRHVAQAKAALKGASVQLASVIGFPAGKASLAEERRMPTIGDIPPEVKVAQARQAVEDGADELDIVLPVRRFKAGCRDGRMDEVREELHALRRVAPGAYLKVILETDLLDTDEIKAAVALCVETGMDMLKTSTGMLEGAQGATVDIIRMLAEELRRNEAPVNIKASGGVKTAEQVRALIQAGATRIGSSSGLALLEN